MIIIGILLVAGARMIGSGPRLAPGVAMISAMSIESREIAQTTGQKTRLLIYGPNGDPVRQLRFLQIAVEDENGAWSVEGSSQELPRGVFFNHPLSVNSASAVAGLGSVSDLSSGIAFPGNDTAAYYYVQFNAEGICALDGDAKPGAALILQQSPRDMISSSPGTRRVSGILIWRNGSITQYESPSQMSL